MIEHLLHIGSNKLRYNGIFHTISGSTYLSAVDPFGFNLYNPSSLWYNGKQYFTFRRNHNSSDGKPIICVYDGTTLTTRIITEASGVQLDYHNNTTICIDNSGYIYVILEQHGSQSQIYKSDSVEDVSAFTKLTHNLPALDYPKIGYTSQGFICYGRRNAPNYDLISCVSADALTWTSNVMSVPIAEASEPDFRHYPYIGKNWIQDNWLHVTAYKRTYDGVSEFRNIYGWKLKTPIDSNMGVVWYNDAETFNKDISVSALTETELKANCQIWSAPNNEAQESSGIYINEYHSHQYRTDLVQDRLYNSNGNNLLEAGHLLNSGNKLFALGDPDGTFALSELDVSGAVLSRQQAFYVPTDGLLYHAQAFNWIFSYPQNLNDIPKGGKFLVCAPTDKDGGYNRESTTNNDVTCWEILKNENST